MKRKIFLTVGFLISIAPMLLNLYGGARGVQEISGLITLYNPIGVLSLICFFVGVWRPFKKENIGKMVALPGVLGIPAAYIYTFFTWHIQTVSGIQSLEVSRRMVFPEFYPAVGISVLFALVYITVNWPVKMQSDIYKQ